MRFIFKAVARFMHEMAQLLLMQFVVTWAFGMIDRLLSGNRDTVAA